MSTLFERKSAAKARGESMLTAALGFTASEWAAKVHRKDMWQLTLVLGTALAYLYTRRAETTILIFVFFYFLEYFVFWLLAYLLRNSTAAVEMTHSRSLSLLTDPIVAGLSLLVAFYILEFTAIGQTGAGADIVVARGLQETGRTIVVLLAALLTGFVRLYWLALPLLLAVVWIAYAFDSGRAPPVPDYALWLATRASIFVVFYGIAFLRPIGETFLSNAWFALAAATWFASAIQFVFEQQ